MDGWMEIIQTMCWRQGEQFLSSAIPIQNTICHSEWISTYHPVKKKKEKKRKFIHSPRSINWEQSGDSLTPIITMLQLITNKGRVRACIHELGERERLRRVHDGMYFSHGALEGKGLTSSVFLIMFEMPTFVTSRNLLIHLFNTFLYQV